MAYVSNNLSKMGGGFIEDTQVVWIYKTTSDSDGTITGAAYFSDGDKKGMKLGDLVDVIASTGPKYKRYQVTTVTVGTGVTVSAPTAIT